MPVPSWLSDLVMPTAVDAGSIAELRAELDGAARAALLHAGHVDADLLPLRVPKGRITEIERCERSAVASARPAAPSAPETGTDALGLLRGIALDRFVTHQLVAGRVLEPSAALRSMCDAEGELDLVEQIDGLDESTLAESLDPLASSVADAWTGIDPSWAPRTQSRATIVLAAGDVICSGVVDVELGGPTTGLPGVVVEVKSGRPASSHQAEAYLYALLVGLRDGVAPVNVARWYPGSPPAGTPVTLGVLEAAAARLTDAIGTWAELRAGRPAGESPGRWCRWCADAEVCPSARLDDDGDPDDGATSDEC